MYCVFILYNMDLQKVDVEIKWLFKLFLGGGSGVGKLHYA